MIEDRNSATFSFKGKMYPKYFSRKNEKNRVIRWYFSLSNILFETLKTSNRL